MSTQAFFVPGAPKPKGSRKNIVNKKTLKVNSFNDNPGTKSWQSVVHYYAKRNVKGKYAGPVRVVLTFGMPKPKRPKFYEPAVKPDLDKLARAVLDALTGVAYFDDAQVVGLNLKKEYSDRPGILVEISA